MDQKDNCGDSKEKNDEIDYIKKMEVFVMIAAKTKDGVVAMTELPDKLLIHSMDFTATYNIFNKMVNITPKHVFPTDGRHCFHHNKKRVLFLQCDKIVQGFTLDYIKEEIQIIEDAGHILISQHISKDNKLCYTPHAYYDIVVNLSICIFPNERCTPRVINGNRNKDINIEQQKIQSLGPDKIRPLQNGN